MATSTIIGDSVSPGFGIGGVASGGPDGNSRAEAWLYRRLRSATGLVALRDQIHPIMAPIGTPLPYAVYTATTTAGDQHFTGSLDEEKTRFSILIFARGHAEVRALAGAAARALRDVAGWSLGAKVLHSTVPERGADRAVQSDGGDLLPLYGQEISVEVRLTTPRRKSNHA
jgi:hypothetical protein